MSVTPRSGRWWGTPSQWAARCRSQWSSMIPPSTTTPTPGTPATSECGPSVGGELGKGGDRRGATLDPPLLAPQFCPTALSVGCTNPTAAWRTCSCPGDTTVSVGGTQRPRTLCTGRMSGGAAPNRPPPSRHAQSIGVGGGSSPAPPNTPFLHRVHVQSDEVQQLRPAQGGRGGLGLCVCVGGGTPKGWMLPHPPTPPKMPQPCTHPSRLST